MDNVNVYILKEFNNYFCNCQEELATVEMDSRVRCYKKVLNQSQSGFIWDNAGENKKY